MLRLSRRVILGGMAAVPLAMPGIVRAQSTSKPIRIGCYPIWAARTAMSGGRATAGPLNLRCRIWGGGAGA